MLFWSLFVSVLGAALAYLRRDLTLLGALGAAAVGTLIAYCGGWNWFIVLAAFFISSSAATVFKAGRKEEVQKHFSKTRPRDLGQVLANGGIPALMAVLFAVVGEKPVFYLVFLGAMATATADTWATEIGVLAKGRVLSIRDWKKVERGTSGGVSLLGTLAGLTGALLIAAVGGVWGLLFSGFYIPVEYIIPPVTIGGFLGCLLDSVLGAAVQARYECSVCGLVTEKDGHCCGPDPLVGGWRWVDNDLVNFMSSLLGGIITVAVVFLHLTFFGAQP
ncbi:MAG: DUF92 domain-containing protein [Firmicutes bacterium]|nr:DUF92 domain-containing protein [Bacillota bacterium]